MSPLDAVLLVLCGALAVGLAHFWYQARWLRGRVRRSDRAGAPAARDPAPDEPAPDDGRAALERRVQELEEREVDLTVRLLDAEDRYCELQARLGTSAETLPPSAPAEAFDDRHELEDGVVPTAPARSRQATVLLAEDEEGLRTVMTEVLTVAGYTVLAAANGEEALSLAEAHDGAIDLLLTDLHMPRMGGRQLALRLGLRVPGLRVLYISSMVNAELAAKAVTEPHEEFLPKPVAPDVLVSTVHELLRARLGPRP
jgi:CheY-like chemotaxis protein